MISNLKKMFYVLFNTLTCICLLLSFVLLEAFLSNKASVIAETYTQTFNINDLNTDITITQAGNYLINGNGRPTNNLIKVDASNINVTITLNNVNIDVSSRYDKEAFFAKNYDQSNVKETIILKGDNKLKSANSHAGLMWNNNDSNSELIIKGDGSLIAIGGDSGAGIGANWSSWGTINITILSGNIYAKGGSDAAGIGGGFRGDGSNIIIQEGSITADGKNDIGGYWNTGYYNIFITNGSVKSSKFPQG